LCLALGTILHHCNASNFVQNGASGMAPLLNGRLSANMLLLVVFLMGCAVALMGHGSMVLLSARINRHLHPEKQVSYFLSNPWTILREYRRLYPGSRLYLLPWFFLGMGFLSLCGWLMFRA
jgi:hypothetical protein